MWTTRTARCFTQRDSRGARAQRWDLGVSGVELEPRAARFPAADEPCTESLRPPSTRRRLHASATAYLGLNLLATMEFDK
ncbi:hypothetical protein A5722_01705 [Mycobacterium vulneris]|nr:hypothetical protein [Mycobacteriaceae bacterium Msp059]OBK07483.1 hypothetical protein A5637_05075 [Mycolicibacterium fortuitum]OCB44917.1 hypothetical protein A5721_18735 [Mycolicibacterium vulneris]OBK57266.1 hypothetical protein A5654_04005 [Mycolicibacterium fortuitum]OCB60550.1 hypothetical protein A5722_01705 [Mycolicibacterium vulneris]